MEHVSSARADFSMEKTREIAKSSIHTDIHNGQLSLVHSGQDIDGCTFAKEILHHLLSDFLGICTDTFGSYSMIGCKNINGFVQRPARGAFADGNKSCRNVLETAK